jgi:co-chaperonin GroES (HSP10)
MSFRPLKDAVLVQCEPAKEQIGSIFLANQEPRITFARVLAVGPGREKKNGVREPPDVSVGERVCFISMHMDTPKGAQPTSTLRELGENIGLIQDRDILFAIADGEEITVE